jgi:hypothetical protein
MCMVFLKCPITDTQIYLGFLFNIYTKIKYEDETFKNTTRVERIVRKLEYI